MPNGTAEPFKEIITRLWIKPYIVPDITEVSLLDRCFIWLPAFDFPNAGLPRPGQPSGKPKQSERRCCRNSIRPSDFQRGPTIAAISESEKQLRFPPGAEMAEQFLGIWRIEAPGVRRAEFQACAAFDTAFGSADRRALVRQ